MATATNAQSNAASVQSAITRKQRSTASHGPGYPSGYKILKQTVSLAATDLQNGDSVDILVFPQDCYLQGLRIKATELDTGVDALTFDIRVDSDVLINNSTIGQGGGSDEMDSNIDPTLLDVSGSTLKFVPETSAGLGAAGTLTVYAYVLLNSVIDAW